MFLNAAASEASGIVLWVARIVPQGLPHTELVGRRLGTSIPAAYTVFTTASFLVATLLCYSLIKQDVDLYYNKIDVLFSGHLITEEEAKKKRLLWSKCSER